MYKKNTAIGTLFTDDDDNNDYDNVGDVVMIMHGVGDDVHDDDNENKNIVVVRTMTMSVMMMSKDDDDDDS